ncbi:ABC transporter ATP-binding protein [Arenibacterium halophilum]|uniref:Spermidine/putrescine import ATP-binding protein PotA n=1 Tax=Arenibacterium halophilum TaxID=2583821 RepID=A0ABY2XG79_9RHOB|nr:ABC transporter ATP-binding protein [Arenibacterium halophilum]TMV15478.1 ABC transporter ATP-binding protein [Arenibacterium halophilum]
MTPVVQMRNIVKRYGSVTAIDNVSLDVGDNEFFALLGPSGCGKTTLLRTLAGFEAPQGGQVIVGGQDVTRLRPAKRPLNLMFQSYALFPHMSVARNVAYGLEMERLPKPEIDSRVAEVLEAAQLGGFANRRPDQLSGGQRQRVALARALVKRPRVLLLDEPLSALDKKLRQDMQLELKRLQAEMGITFLIVTHDQEEALVMADRIAVLKDGKLAQVGSPGELYEHPASRFVAGFIGEMNFVEGTATAQGVEVPGLGLLRGASTLTGPAVLAVRPERVDLLTATPGDGRNAVTGTVEQVAYHGADMGVHVRLTNGAVMRALLRAGQDAPAIGAPATCAWAAEHSRILPE